MRRRDDVRPNWFVALPVDGAWLDRRIAHVPQGFRRFHADDLHLTVAFFGAVDARAATRGFEALADEGLLGSIACTLGDVVPMGSPTRYSALSALLGEGRERVEALMRRWRDRMLDAAGVPRESRAPKAHVTITRPSRRATEEERDAGLVWARAIDLRDVSFTLDRVALYTWDETRAIRQFRVVDSKPI